MRRAEAYIQDCKLECSKGVYAWLFYIGNKRQCLYVGQSKVSALARAAMYRGSPKVSSDDGKTPDTDFIVKVCIDYLLERGISCYWEYINDNPNEERNVAIEYETVTQEIKEKAVHLHEEFRKDKRIKGYWTENKKFEATGKIKAAFKKILKEKNISVPDNPI